MLRKRRGGQTKKYKKARRGGRKENKAEAGCRRGYYMKARVAGAKNTTKKGGERCCESTLGNKIT